MFKVADKIIHKTQELGYSCGAAAVAMMLGQPEKVIRPLVHCSRDGTYSHNVVGFLSSNVGVTHEVLIDSDYHNVIGHLTALSFKYAFYCSATYLWKNPGRGRPLTRHHASLFADGYIYDPGEPRETDTFSYEHTFNKRLLIKSIVLVEAERPNFLKNFRKNEIFC